MISRVLNRLKALFTKKELDAASAWHQSGGEAAHAYWLYAAPVHLSLGRDNFFMTEPAPLPLVEDEVDAILSSLNAHFAGDGLCFYVKEEVWYLGLDENPKVELTPLKQVFNKDLAGNMPTGEGALAWARLQNEVQMLLSRHPVNQARESEGQPVVNSVWFYGLGRVAES